MVRDRQSTLCRTEKLKGAVLPESTKECRKRVFLSLRAFLSFYRKRKKAKKTIESLKLGDKALSWNPETGKLEYRMITNLFERKTDLIYKLTFSSGRTVETTWNHPFWVSSTGTSTGSVSDISSLQAGKWIETKDLKVGDVLKTANSSPLFISAISTDARMETVYNFEVEGNHTYFVGEDGVLVHNQSNAYGAYNGGAIVANLAEKAWNGVKGWFGKEEKTPQKNIAQDSANKKAYYSEDPNVTGPVSDVKYKFEAEGEGWFNNGGNSKEALEHKYGSEATVKTLANTISAWNESNPKSPIGVNDLSMPGGEKSPYNHHQYDNVDRETGKPWKNPDVGKMFDVKFQSSDGKPGTSGSYDAKGSNYSSQKTIEMIDTIRKSVPTGYEVRQVWFNDSKVIDYYQNNKIKNSYDKPLVRKSDSTHDTHLHVIVDRKKGAK